jgi:putative ATP-binding cassette transporter
MALPYFRESSRGKWLFAGMILLTLIDSAVKILFSFTSRAFFNALEHKDAASFSRVLILYTSILVAGAPVSSFYNFQRERLAIAWRDWMTNRTLNLYTNSRVYYVLDKDIDNPDQRIAQDVDAFTAYSLRLLVTVLDNTINLISFSVIICTIEPELFLVIVVYAFAGTVISTWIGARLVPLNFELLQSEADFRYSLVRLREHSESIAFYKGEDLEKENLRLRFESILDTRRDIIGTERNLEVFTSLYQYLTWVVPIAVVAPRYFEGSIDLGVVMQTRYAFLQIVGDLSM